MKKPLLPLLVTVAVALTGCAPHRMIGAGTSAPVREDIEWLDVWLPESNARDLPRVLLIGDSITRGYYPEVQARLQAQAYVARLTAPQTT